MARVSLRPEDVDGIVFWTKDARALVEVLLRLEGAPFYAQATLTPYGREIEPACADKAAYPERCVALRTRGSDAVVWRYDPILPGSPWTEAKHAEAFAATARRLWGVCNLCVISFLDVYADKAARMGRVAGRPLKRRKAAGQRTACGCNHSRDVARYGTCAMAASIVTQAGASDCRDPRFQFAVIPVSGQTHE